MNTIKAENREELLIVSITPQNLERGILWFRENQNQIKKIRGAHAWWRTNSFLIERDLLLRPSEFIRTLLDFGYERSSRVVGKGLFAVRGGVIELWAINHAHAYLIEFAGNTIASITKRPETEELTRPQPIIRSIEKLGEGGFVVHEDHGIGIFRGKRTMEGKKFLLVEYAAPAQGRAPDILYVPEYQEKRLTPYIGFETPRVHRLGGTVWMMTKRKVKEDATRLAQDLLLIYKKRATARRDPYEGDQLLEASLRCSFPHTETPDQLKAESEIMADLALSRPMDRVLVGDVGFGKTEIALRAALRVVTSGKQVVVLAPTTILAAQHEKTIRDRLGTLPIEIRMLSRLTPKKMQRSAIADIASGKADIIIGTHRLLSPDISFKNLGLAIIDEEQRFGVTQKERFSSLRADIDVLSLSATPIPRTLHAALSGAREISEIATPPPERKSIQTYILPWSRKIIKEAIAYELRRAGQIYFLHNRIETIGRAQDRIASLGLRPKPRIEIMHGRMKEQDMMEAMERFRTKKSDILLATTIIENGIDISSANTLIVDDATRLGLAQSHQLRGRIGRGETQGFAYFLFRSRNLVATSAERLEALQEYAKLGAGYQIALRDLEIRGAGNILGREQSGAMNKVGFNLYCQILNEAVEELKR